MFVIITVIMTDLYTLSVIFCAYIVRQQKKFQLNPESYNGAVRDNYSWSQSITDVDIRVTVCVTFLSILCMLIAEISL